MTLEYESLRCHYFQLLSHVNSTQVVYGFNADRMRNGFVTRSNNLPYI